MDSGCYIVSGSRGVVIQNRGFIRLMDESPTVYQFKFSAIVYGLPQQTLTGRLSKVFGGLLNPKISGNSVKKFSRIRLVAVRYKSLQMLHSSGALYWQHWLPNMCKTSIVSRTSFWRLAQRCWIFGGQSHILPANDLCECHPKNSKRVRSLTHFPIATLPKAKVAISSRVRRESDSSKESPPSSQSFALLDSEQDSR